MLPVIDLVLLMSVEPGFGGQKFIPGVLEKVKKLSSMYPDLMIQMDGGIDSETAPACRDSGAKNLVSGNYIFTSTDRPLAIRTLRGS